MQLDFLKRLAIMALSHIMAPASFEFCVKRLRREKLGQAKEADKKDTDTVCFGTNAVL